MALTAKKQRETMAAPKGRIDKPTKAELAAIRRGEAEIAEGEFVTLTEFLHEMDAHRREVGAKTGRKVSR